MTKREFVRRALRESKAVLKLSPLILISLLLAVVLWQTDSAAIAGLFQSPPEGTPTSEAPLPTETVAPEATPTLPPAETVAPTQTPAPTLTPAPTQPPPTATLEPSPTSSPGGGMPVESGAEGSEGDSQRYAEDDTSLKFEWGMLFDSVALLLSYTWLCCGVFILLAVPVVFVVLWVISKRRQQAEE